MAHPKLNNTTLVISTDGNHTYASTVDGKVVYVSTDLGDALENGWAALIKYLDNFPGENK